MTSFYPFKSRDKYESGGINQDSTWLVTCEAIGKSRTTDHPYLLANEWIAACIAQFLRLPIPPFALMRDRTRNSVMFCSFSFEGDSTPRDVDPFALYQLHGETCTGIVLFDILILNCDRNSSNLKVDNRRNPRNFYIFDHERAMFYIYPKAGIDHLNSRIDRLGITDGDASNDNYHCLVDHIANVSHIKSWLSRIESIPDWFFEKICNEVKRCGITKPECSKAIEFLIQRRNSLKDLVYEHRGRFTGTNPDDWGLFA